MRISPVEGIVHRYPDRVLLKLVNACAVYCRFCFRREMVGPGRGGLSPRGARGGARLHPRPSANLGSDPDRRRSAGAVAAPARGRDGAACRDRPRQGDPRAHARAGRGAGADHAGAGARAARADKATFVVAARQSSARTDRAGPRRLRAPDRCRHSDAVANRCCCAASTTTSRRWAR